MALPAEGGCRCSQLRFRITALPLLAMVCHCAGCQRMSGSAFSTTAMMASTAFEVISGRTLLGGPKGPRLHHHHCADCLSWVYTSFEDSDAVINLRATMLDEPSWFVPLIESCTVDKLPWAETGARHSYAHFPPPEHRDALMAEYAETLTPKEI